MTIAHDAGRDFAGASLSVPSGSAQAVNLNGASEPAVRREKFIPVTVHAIVDRLADASVWPRGEAASVRRFFTYLEHWRRQQYNAELKDLLEAYEPFSPDSDLLITRKFTAAERRQMQRRVITDVEHILVQANYERIDPAQVEMIMTRESHYGLDINIDFGAFEDCLIFYRGATTKKDTRRNPKKFLRKEEFDVPIFQRLFILFKVKPFAIRVREVMAEKKISRNEAEKVVTQLRNLLPNEIKEDNIYMKLFKNIPRSDLEMIFPNPRVKFRLFDKIKLGVTAGGGLGMGAIGAAGKLALVASNPIAAAGAVAGLGGIAFRQGVNFLNQKQRYMVVLAQNLYFHAMADNRGVMIKLADRAAEEDVKEDLLLYTVLAKEPALRSDINAIDKAVENYIQSHFGIAVDFDVRDALQRLEADGLVTENRDGTLRALAPREAAALLDKKWDLFLDQLADYGQLDEGREFEGSAPNGVA